MLYSGTTAAWNTLHIMHLSKSTVKATPILPFGQHGRFIIGQRPCDQVCAGDGNMWSVHCACMCMFFILKTNTRCAFLKTNTRCMQGTAVYVPEKEALVWKIKSFPGGREFLLRAKFSLPSVAAEEEPHGRMPPIAVNFEIPYFTVSGIQVWPSCRFPVAYLRETNMRS